MHYPYLRNYDPILPLKNFKDKPSLELYAVLVKEKYPPRGIKPIEWFLITSMPVLSFEDALEKVQWYKERWKIENFQFNTFESVDKTI